MSPQIWGTFVNRCNVRRITRVLLTVSVLLAPLGCQSSSGEKWLRWPWKKDKPAPVGDNVPTGTVDPFLPPPRTGNPPGDGVSQNDRLDHPVVHLSRPKLQPIALVSATNAETASGPGTLEDILHPLAQRREYQYIVLHHSRSESGNLEKIDADHRQTLGWEGCGFHFVIGNGDGAGDGQVQASQRWKLQKHGAHLSSKTPAAYNINGIGVCLVGDFSRQRPTEEQLAATRQLVSYLMREYSIPAYRVVTHDEVTADGEHGRECPGPLFRVEDVLAETR